MKARLNSSLSLLAMSLLGGCATITGDSTQSIGVETYARNGEKLTGVNCTALNDKGSWMLVAPNSVVVRRSAEDVMINCQKEGHEPGTTRLISRSNAGIWGNIIFGGGVGAIIDHNKGTGYTYPGWVKVQMGKTLTFDRMDEKEGMPATAKEESNTVPEERAAVAASSPSGSCNGKPC
jgi:hypothetical protein